MAAKPKAVQFIWRHLTLSVTHTPDYLSPGWSHLELRVIKPKGAPCPLTETGYRSHFLDGEQLAALGGPIAFITAWLDREAATKAWARTEARWRQLELFR